MKLRLLATSFSVWAAMASAGWCAIVVSKNGPPTVLCDGSFKTVITYRTTDKTTLQGNAVKLGNIADFAAIAANPMNPTITPTGRDVEITGTLRNACLRGRTTLTLNGNQTEKIVIDPVPFSRVAMPPSPVQADSETREFKYPITLTPCGGAGNALLAIDSSNGVTGESVGPRNVNLAGPAKDVSVKGKLAKGAPSGAVTVRATAPAVICRLPKTEISE